MGPDRLDASRDLEANRSRGPSRKAAEQVSDRNPSCEHPHATDQPSQEVTDQNRWLNAVPTRADLTEHYYSAMV